MSPERRTAALRFIVALGVVSLLADMTYEGARSVVGPFLGDLGAGALQVGLIAGFGEMAAASLRLVSGRLADRTRAYWVFVFAGYGINVLVVPAMAFAGTWQAAAVLVAAERVGKSLRGPSRDVLLSGATAEVGHGWGFGLHAAMDQAGAVLGPLIVVLVMTRSASFAPAFLVLAIPAALAVLALVYARTLKPAAREPAAAPALGHPPAVFWMYVGAACLLALGFADFALLAFHMRRTGLVSAAAIPLLYAGAMAMNALFALLFGRLFDRIGAAALPIGIALSVLALPLGFLGGPALVMAGVACWGVGMGLQDGVLRAGIARIVPMHKRGTAYGTYSALFGVAWFAGSAMMGWLYEMSVVWVVMFGVAAQLLAAATFTALRGALAPETQRGG
jgi:MFS family permease